MKIFASTQKFNMMYFLTLIMLIISSCTAVSKAPSSEDLSYQKFAFPDGTLVLGISLPMTREEIITGCNPGFRVTVPPLYNELKTLGFNDEDIKDNSVALILNSMYWNNSRANKRADYGLHWAIVPRGIIPKLTKDHSSVVEVKVNKGIGEITQILYPNFNESSCDFKEDKKPTGEAVLDVLTYLGAGPSGSASFQCEGLIEEGWETKKYGWKNEFIWVKYPEGDAPPGD